MAAEAFAGSSFWSNVGPNYTWPRGSKTEESEYIMYGRMDRLPPTPSKTARIFLSSTFTDTYAERNLLIKSVYPKLKKICKERFDLDFQVVDMRWGVRNEATVDHSAGALCMAEIDNCIKYSVGPTFVALLSHRCGGRALPTCIPQKEMQQIIQAIKSWDDHADCLSLVEKWYKLDENAIPSEYNLLPIVKYEDMEKFIKEPTKGYYYEAGDHLRDLTEDFTEIDALEKLIGDFGDEGEAVEEAKLVYKTMSNQEKKVWAAEEPELSRAIRQAISQCIQNDTLTRDSCHKYFQSITEEEVRRGLLEDPERGDHCLVFRRIIDNINMGHKKAWRFIDMTDDNQLDTEAQQLLNHLRDVEVPERLPKENLFDFRVTWSDNEGINEVDHAVYLEEFCATFEQSVLELIERGVERAQQLVMSEQVCSEVLEHSHQCVQRVRSFHGREAELETIKNYIMSEADQPLIVHGESGCGKTSVLAKAASMIPNWIGDNKDVCVILRFLGTTLESSTVSKMLTSIMQQIISITGLRKKYPTLPEQFTDLKNIFKELLTAIPSRKRVIIMLDSLDQLSDVKDLNGLLWIPQKLSSNVKFTVSTIPEENNILDRLKSPEMNLSLIQFTEVTVMDKEQSRQVIQMWLHAQNRKLTTDQNALVDEHIKDNAKPLYLKLIFDEISKWKSYQQTGKFYCPNISSCLHRLFRKTEVKHGEMIVRHALGYLCASKNGLTNLEMEDVLSLDEDVLTDVFEFHVPPIRRLPSILWARIKNDLQDYLVERGADGVRVMTWYHKQLILDAKRRYLPGKHGFEIGGDYNPKNLHLYKVLAEYFAGVWGGEREKPFKFTKFQQKKLGILSNDAALPRYVPDQPSIYQQPDGSLDIENIKFNRRKMSELPNACEAVMNTEDMTAFVAEQIVFNQQFLTAWLGVSPWEDIAYFMNLMSRGNDFVPENDSLGDRLSQLQDKTVTNYDRDMLSQSTEGLALQMSAILQSLVLSYTSAINNPSYIGADITGRLLRHNNSMYGINHWIKYTDNEGRQLCALVPPHTHLEPPGSELFYVLNNHKAPVRDAIWSPVDDELCISVSHKLAVTSLESGQIILETKPKSVPKQDYFCKVTTLLTEYKKVLYIAMLKKHPWLYVFTEAAEVLTVVDLSVYIKGAIEVSELKAFLCSSSEVGTSTDCVLITDKTRNKLICLQNILHEKATCTEISNDNTEKIRAVFVSHVEQNSEQTCHQTRILLLKERGTWELYDGKFGLLDVCHFQWQPVSSAYEDVNKSSKTSTIVIGLENGQVCLVKWDSCISDLQHTDPIYFEKNTSQLSSDSVCNGPVHYVCYQTAMKKDDDSETYESGKNSSAYEKASMDDHTMKSASDKIDQEEDYALGAAHTESTFYLFRLTSTNQRQQHSSDLHKSKSLVDESRNKTKQWLHILWKKDRKYDFSMFSRNLHFVFAAYGGTVDVLKINNGGNKPNAEFRVTTFMTLAIHSDDITKILPMEDDVFFMTASKDSTMKFNLLGRARISRKYRLQFDRTDQRISQILGGESTAITWAQQSRTIFQWDVVCGKIIKMFQNLHKESFIICATDDKKDLLAALDTAGNLYIWNMMKSSEGKMSEDRGLFSSQRHIESPKPTRVIKTSIPADQLNDTQHSFLLVLPQNTVIFTVKGDNKAYVITHEGNHKDTKMDYTTRAPLEYALTLSSGQFMFVSKKECSVSDHEGTSLKHVYSLIGLLGKKAKVRDIKVTQHLGQMIFLLRDEVVLWKPGTNGKTGAISLADERSSDDNNASMNTKPTTEENLSPNKLSPTPDSTATSTTHNGQSQRSQKANLLTGATCLLVSEGPLCMVLDKSTKHYAVLNLESQKLLSTRKLSGRDPVEFCTLTPDGAYLVYVSGERQLYLMRLSDGKLLAWYTMYTTVCSLAISSNGWFVLVGTADKRLFVLVIADPDEETHSERIAHVRAANPPLEENVVAQLMGNINDYNNYSPDISDSEEDMDMPDDGRNETEDKGIDRGEEEESFSDADWTGKNKDYSIMCETGEKVVKDGVLFTNAPCSVQ